MIDRQAMLSKALLFLALLGLGSMGISEIEKIDFQKAMNVFQKNLEQTLSLSSSSKESNTQAFQNQNSLNEKLIMLRVTYESWTPQPIRKDEFCKHYTDYEICKKEKEGKEE